MKTVFFIFALGLLLYASYTDIRMRKIFNPVIMMLFANWAFFCIYMSFAYGAVYLTGLKSIGTCLVTAVLVFILTNGMKKISGKKMFGGGDIKLIFSAGLILKPDDFFLMLLIAFMISGLYGVFARRSFKGVPFAPAVFGGFLFSVFINI